MTLTEPAADYLYETLTETDVPQNSIIRLSINGATIEMNIDREKPEDTVVLYKKILLVALTRETANQLESITVDVLVTKNGRKLVVK